MINLSFDETHHIYNNQPLYSSRYTRVMSFHNGIAPVEQNKKSFFIDESNQKLFDRSFLKAYGFYDGLSAVKDKSGWFHIDLQGVDLYSQRYKWVGNFNEGVSVVRDNEMNYFHINNKGKRIYNQNYTYTGDYKYGIAVVVNKKALSTHINKEGKEIHGIFFEELNVFHKGYAIAKDKKGYFHINKIGKALYPQRYKRIEDFYNASAYATTLDNQKIILLEEELNQLELTVLKIDKEKILNDSFSYFKYQILFAILKLNVLQNIDQSQALNLPSVSEKLILKWLLVERIITKDNKLTKLGDVIEKELKPLILYWQDLPFKTSAYLVDSLQQGEEVFSKLYNKPYFDFLLEDSNYMQLSISMNNYYTIDYQHLFKHLKLTTQKVCDIGGGNGKMLNQLQKYYPNIRTINTDKFSNQKNTIKIDFFKPFRIKSDIFISSRIFHDWNDKKASIILKNIVKNMNKNTIFYICETIIPLDNDEDKGITLSFHLLNFLGGYERTLKDFQRLLDTVGLRIVKIYEKNKLISMIKVVKK